MKFASALMLGGAACLIGIKVAPNAFGIEILNDNALNYWLVGLIIASGVANLVASKKTGAVNA